MINYKLIKHLHCKCSDKIEKLNNDKVEHYVRSPKVSIAYKRSQAKASL